MFTLEESFHIACVPWCWDCLYFCNCRQ